jgi:hypothetical protein
MKDTHRNIHDTVTPFWHFPKGPELFVSRVFMAWPGETRRKMPPLAIRARHNQREMDRVGKTGKEKYDRPERLSASLLNYDKAFYHSGGSGES